MVILRRLRQRSVFWKALLHLWTPSTPMLFA